MPSALTVDGPRPSSVADDHPADLSDQHQQERYGRRIRLNRNTAVRPCQQRQNEIGAPGEIRFQGRW